MRKQSAPSDHDSLRGRLLLFDLDSCHYALRAAAVNGLAECGPLREVPGAPPALMGLVEWRGHLLTVLDLPQLLGHTTPNGPPCLIRLAPPWQGTSLFLPVNVRLATLESLGVPPLPATAETVEHEGRRVQLIDPSALVRRTEKQLEEGRTA